MWIRWSSCHAALSGSCWLLWVCLCLADAEEVCSKDDENCLERSGPSVTLCPLPPKGLGPIPVDFQIFSLSDISATLGSDVVNGSWGPPRDLCRARQRVAVIVPYRDRDQHLKMFLNNLHPFLQKQLLEYSIFVVEQGDRKHFNRGSLFNAAFTEISRLPGEYDCLILHDVDHFPENTKNVYSCNHKARHLVTKRAFVGKPYRELNHPSFFGVAAAISPSNFRKVNGYSNEFWGIGTEDQDLYNRIQHHNIEFHRVDDKVGPYREVRHHREGHNPTSNTMRFLPPSTYISGLGNVNYELVDTEHHHLYTKFTVKLLDRDMFPSEA